MSPLTGAVKIGLGCMNLSHAYGEPPSQAHGRQLLLRALDLGITHFDTAALYGFGKNEELVGATLAPHRSRIVLASKCGMTGVNGKRVIDGRPDTLLRTCDEALRRLRTDRIDLYYLHRVDKSVPVEDSVGALKGLVTAGKIGAIGLSEVSERTLRRAHAVHPIAAVQSEYSLWSRNPEAGILAACDELGVQFVAFSPLCRGFFAGNIQGKEDLSDQDIRRGMPRFDATNLPANLQLVRKLAPLAAEKGCSTIQLVLAWLRGHAQQVLAIPGTASIAHLEENVAAAGMTLSAADLTAIEQIVNPHTVSGPRYSAATQAESDAD